MNNIIDKIRGELKDNADKEIAKSARRFFKEGIKTYGMKTSVADKIAKRYWLGVKELSKDEIFSLCEELTVSGYQEEFYGSSRSVKTGCPARLSATPSKKCLRKCVNLQ